MRIHRREQAMTNAWRVPARDARRGRSRGCGRARLWLGLSNENSASCTKHYFLCDAVPKAERSNFRELKRLDPELPGRPPTPQELEVHQGEASE